VPSPRISAVWSPAGSAIAYARDGERAKGKELSNRRSDSNACGPRSTVSPRGAGSPDLAATLSAEGFDTPGTTAPAENITAGASAIATIARFCQPMRVGAAVPARIRSTRLQSVTRQILADSHSEELKNAHRSLADAAGTDHARNKLYTESRSHQPFARGQLARLGIVAGILEPDFTIDWVHARKDIDQAHHAAKTEANGSLCLSMHKVIMDAVEPEGAEPEEKRYG
jgi:hypothetical protein